MSEKFNIHKNSELWDYVGKVELTQELVDVFEEDRKRSERETKSDKRHIAFENIDWDNISNVAEKTKPTIEEQVYTNILLKQLYMLLEGLTEIERRRFILNRMLGLQIVEIARLENVNESAVRKTLKKVQKKIDENIEF